ncbi:MAG: GDYXXLXY domain-containing protein [Magnetococcales bacterium]|nr:GDYXXLXY domain-containing protein [Magnetococcales bacterium]MBF0151945.1 GDYXXLXY domain-containing protein [Magnetococcales bacterium]MBF0174849.1 GDYXXLXY domain-containing protein [Magnetococcales bacterium]MBF0348915.1 GDYXXLXY domain-containing protein [Magnetococcales bacterium]MBF0632861.1 GDYXXLXY domain-containing protein [Magnetococcales bacterium]
MIRSPHNLRIILSLLLPILFFAALVAHKEWTLRHGIEVRLPIEGFDPRDLLAGHYLIYRINYGVLVCTNEHYDQEVPATVCLKPTVAFHSGQEPIAECHLWIKGTCRHNRFEAGIERFFIPEAYARPLDQAVRNKSGEIIVGVTASGTAMVKELLIDGSPWHLAVTPEPIRR